MRLIEKFLLLFADYRELRDKAQAASEEAAALRRTNDDLRQQIKDVQADAIGRERGLTDRFLNGDVEVRKPYTPTAPSEGIKQVDVGQNARVWRQNQHDKFMQDLEERREKLLGGKSA